MGELDDLVREEKVQHLLEECEKAMRLVAEVDASSRDPVQRALDGLFLDLGRTIYNLYWQEDLHTGEHGAELAEITSEVDTVEVKLEVRETPPPPPFLGGPAVDVPGYDDTEPRTAETPRIDPNESTDLPEGDDLGSKEDTGWYTSEVEIPDRPLFTPEDGLQEDIPEPDPVPDPDE